MNPQRIARVTGVLFVITYIASIPPVLLLYGPLLGDPRYIVGGDTADSGASLGALPLALMHPNAWMCHPRNFALLLTVC